MPPLARYGNFPAFEIEPTLYTPDRSLEPRFDEQLGGEQGNAATEMMLVCTDPLDVGLYYRIAGRLLRIESKSNYKEFRSRCPNGPRLLRSQAYKFYFAIPEEEEEI